MSQVAFDRKLLVPASSAPRRISKIQFGTLDSVEMERVSELQVSSRDLYTMPARTPASFGVIDNRLGVSDKSSLCKTCQ